MHLDPDLYFFLTDPDPPKMLIRAKTLGCGWIRTRITAFYLECDVELVRVVYGDDALVRGLVLEVEVELHREYKHWHLPVQNITRTKPGKSIF